MPPGKIRRLESPLWRPARRKGAEPAFLASLQSPRPILARKPPEIRALFRTPVQSPDCGTAWLGREDSNLRMAESKSAALPLGDAPVLRHRNLGSHGAADHSGRTLTPQPRGSEFTQRHLLDAMRDALRQNEARARPRRQDVLVQIAQIRCASRCRARSPPHPCRTDPAYLRK